MFRQTSPAGTSRVLHQSCKSDDTDKARKERPKEQKTKDSRPGQSQRKNRYHPDSSNKLRGTNEHSQQTTKREQGHESILTATNRPKDDTACILEWDSPLGYVPLSEEESMVEFMFRRNGKRERGMLKGKPSYVVSKYRKAMQQHAPTMNFPQLLSLRRLTDVDVEIEVDVL